MDQSASANAKVSVGTLLNLAWPIILARATQAVIGFTDALLTAPLGENALAAVTTGSLNVLSAIILPMGTVFIVQSFTAQLRGRGDLGAARRYAIYGLLLAVLSGLLAAALTPLVPVLLGKLEYSTEVRDLMTEYVSIRLLSVTAAVGTEALGNWYGGLANTRQAMIAGVVAMVANAIGSYALIEPRFGLPGYGVAGAAWASVAASWLGFAVIGYAFVRGHGHDLPPSRFEFKSPELWRVLRFGIPNGINWFLEFSAFILYINVVIGHLGTSVLAAFNVVMQLNSISFMPAFGAASAGAILVGEAIGAGKKARVGSIVRLTLFTNVSWMMSVGLMYLLMPDVWIRLFVPDGGTSSALLAAGTTMLMMSTIWQLFDAMGLTLSEALRAAGDTTWTMLARIVLAWFVFSPAAWLAVFVFDGGIITVMISLIAYIALLALTLVWRFRSRRWEKIDLIGEPAPL